MAQKVQVKRGDLPSTGAQVCQISWTNSQPFPRYGGPQKPLGGGDIWGANFELWSRFPQNCAVPHPRVLHFWLALSPGGNTEALHTQTNSPGGAKLSKSAKITDGVYIWGFITPNLWRQPHNAIHRWKGLRCGHDTVLKRWRHCNICARQEARNEKKLVREKRKTPKKFLGRG